MGEGHGNDNWPLLLRTLLLFCLDLVILVPFIFSQCFATVKSWIPRLLFTRLGTQSSAVIFLNELDLDFPVGPLRARPAMLPYVLAFIAIRIMCWAHEFY